MGHGLVTARTALLTTAGQCSRMATHLSRPTRVIFFALMCAALPGCRDRITGPEAVEIVHALEESARGDSTRAHWYLDQAMGGWSAVLGPVRRASPAATSVMVERNDSVLDYQGIVFERVLIPPAGVDGSNICRFKKGWTLLLWRFGHPTEGFIFSGLTFDNPVRPDHPCWDPPRTEPFPMLFMVRPAQDSTGWPIPETWDAAGRHRSNAAIVWGAEDGAGAISPGEESGGCGFTQEDARLLMDDVATTCVRTRHRVHFDAVLRLPAHLEPLHPPMRRFRVRLPVTEVSGVQYTIHCDQRPDLRICELMPGERP